MMKIAITGASGFIGRRVLDEFERQNIEVTAVTRDARKLKHVSSFHRVIEMDITQAGKSNFEELGSPNTLIHLAWGSLHDFNSPDHIDIELPAHFNFLKSLVESGLPSLIVSGTCLEYGMQYGPLSADLETQPVVAYAIAKDKLRKQLENLYAKTDLNFLWARLFYIYGEEQGPKSLFSQLKNVALEAGAVFNMSGGEQLRDYSQYLFWRANLS